MKCFQRSMLEIGKSVMCCKKKMYLNFFFLIHFRSTAKNLNLLLSLGITHVVNAAQGTGFGMVDTNEQFYHPVNIQYMGLPLYDDPNVAINEYFDSVSNFIDDALSQKGQFK